MGTCGSFAEAHGKSPLQPTLCYVRNFLWIFIRDHTGVHLSGEILRRLHRTCDAAQHFFKVYSRAYAHRPANTHAQQRRTTQQASTSWNQGVGLCHCRQKTLNSQISSLQGRKSQHPVAMRQPMRHHPTRKHSGAVQAVFLKMFSRKGNTEILLRSELRYGDSDLKKFLLFRFF